MAARSRAGASVGPSTGSSAGAGAGGRSGEVVAEGQAGRPAEVLRPYIARYSGYRQAGLAPGRHAGLPSPFLTLIFTLDEPLTVAEHPDPRQPAQEYLTLAGGLHTRPATVTHDGRQSGIQIALSPVGARAILGLPAGELASVDAEGSEVFGELAAQIRQRVQEAVSWEGKFAVLDELLSRRLEDYRQRGRPDVSPEVGFAWNHLLATGGTVTVSELAGLTGWGDRHLRARFAAEIGLTPKAAARVVRFDRARRLLQRRAVAGCKLDLAGLAAHCGYYDQAHLDADFRALAGSPPTTWLARESPQFRILQASD